LDEEIEELERKENARHKEVCEKLDRLASATEQQTAMFTRWMEMQMRNRGES
jgi:hypothetical protein